MIGTLHLKQTGARTMAYTITTYHKDMKSPSMTPLVRVHKFATLEAAKAAAEAIFQKTGSIVGIEQDDDNPS